MYRREFFNFAAAGAMAAPQIAQEDEFQTFIEKIEAVIRRELPDIAALEIKYNPEDERIPLMILAIKG